MKLPSDNWITACLLKGRCRIRILDLVDSGTVAISQASRCGYLWQKTYRTLPSSQCIFQFGPTLIAGNHKWRILIGALILDIKFRCRKLLSQEAFSTSQIRVCGPVNFRSSNPRGPEAVPLTINSTHVSTKISPALWASYLKSSF